MGAGHSHGPAADLTLSRAARLGSIGLLVAVAVATLIGVVLLWPGERPAITGSTGVSMAVAPSRRVG